MSNKSKTNKFTNRRENPFSTPIRQIPSLTSPSSLDSHTSRFSSNLCTPSKIMPGSNSNEMDHEDKASNEIKKFWSGWCQQYTKSDKNKISPKTQDFLGMHDSLQEAIIQIQEKDSYYNHEIFLNIINTNDNDIKTILSIEDINFLNASQKISSFTLTSSQVNYIHLLVDIKIIQPIERINFEALTKTATKTINTDSNSNITISNTRTDDICNESASVFEKITGLTPYIKCVIRGFSRILNYEIIKPFDTSINKNTWTIKVLLIFLEPLLDSVPNIKTFWAEHYSDASKARMNTIKKSHKVNFDVMWQDYLKKEKWEINKEIYNIIQTMQVFGAHSH
ncbi:36168_t:CDS:2, partial [Racocetra persica]